MFGYANVPILEQEDRGDIFIKYKWSLFNRDGGLQHQESATHNAVLESLCKPIQPTLT